MQSAERPVGSDDSELVGVRQNQRYAFLATAVQRDLELPLLDWPAVSQGHSVRISHHWYPSSGIVKTSEYLAFFSGNHIRARKQLPRCKFKFIGSV